MQKFENRLRIDKVTESLKVGHFLRHSVDYSLRFTVYILCVQCLFQNRKWHIVVVMRLRVVYRLKCLMVTTVKLLYYMSIAAARVCRAVFMQMWYKTPIQTFTESVHSLSR